MAGFQLTNAAQKKFGLGLLAMLILQVFDAFAAPCMLALLEPSVLWVVGGLLQFVF